MKPAGKKYEWVVQPAFKANQQLVPQGYISIPSQVILLRSALEFVRDNDLIYRWRYPTFSNGSDNPIYDLDILSTMQFSPWTAFSIPRRVDSGFIQQAGTRDRFASFKWTSKWFTYFCFSNEADMVKFILVWR